MSKSALKSSISCLKLSTFATNSGSYFFELYFYFFPDCEPFIGLVEFLFVYLSTATEFSFQNRFLRLLYTAPLPLPEYITYAWEFPRLLKGVFKNSSVLMTSSGFRFIEFFSGDCITLKAKVESSISLD